MKNLIKKIKSKIKTKHAFTLKLTEKEKWPVTEDEEEKLFYDISNMIYNTPIEIRSDVNKFKVKIDEILDDFLVSFVEQVSEMGESRIKDEKEKFLIYLKKRIQNSQIHIIQMSKKGHIAVTKREDDD